MTRGVLAAWALGALLACDDGDESAVPGSIGAACGPTPCEPGLVCRDGRCLERADATIEDAGPPPLIRFDVADSSLEALDAPESADSAPVAGDAVMEEVLFLGDHDALDDPSETRLTLGLGQAAMREVVVPDGPYRQPLVLEVLATSVADLHACGRFAIELWVPDPASGTLAATPTWRSNELELYAAEVPQLLAMTGAPVVAPGPVRIGLSAVGSCEGATLPPWIVLDASGVVSDSFVWAGGWIAGVSLGLPGRWAVRLGVGAGLP